MANPGRIISSLRSSRVLFAVGLRLALAGVVVMVMYFLIVLESPIQNLRENMSWMIPVGILLWILSVGFGAAGVVVKSWESGEPLSTAETRGRDVIPGSSGRATHWLAAARLQIEKRFPMLFPMDWSLPLIRSLSEASLVRLGAGYFDEIGYETESAGRCGVEGDIVLREDGRVVGIVLCVRSEDRLAGLEELERLCGAMRKIEVKHRVLLTDGDFTEEAHAFAADKAVELISGEAFLEKLSSLSSEASQRLFRQVVQHR